MELNEIVKTKQPELYLIGRLFAVFVFAPYLIYAGNKYRNRILILLGIVLFLWDGAKLGLQLHSDDFSY